MWIVLYNPEEILLFSMENLSLCICNFNSKIVFTTLIYLSNQFLDSLFRLKKSTIVVAF